MTRPRLVGLDLSLTGTGICVEGVCDTIRTRQAGLDRLHHIRAVVLAAVELADLVIVEGYSFGSTGAAVYQIGELGGLIRWTLWYHDIPFVDVPPSTVKLFVTGKGNAGKDAMVARAARAGCPADDNNAVDAWCLYQMGCYVYGAGSVYGPAAVRDRAVSGVVWPAVPVRPAA